MKVLFAASEAYPFAMSGGLADVAGALPKALRKRLVGCRVVLPLYESVPQELRDKMQFVKGITVPVAWRRQYCGIFEAHVDGVIYYLLDNITDISIGCNIVRNHNIAFIIRRAGGKRKE